METADRGEMCETGLDEVRVCLVRQAAAVTQQDGNRQSAFVGQLAPLIHHEPLNS